MVSNYRLDRRCTEARFEFKVIKVVALSKIGERRFVMINLLIIVSLLVLEIGLKVGLLLLGLPWIHHHHLLHLLRLWGEVCINVDVDVCHFL
jgi:hypothetical protein